MKEKGKPIVTNDCVQEYSLEEVQNRKFVEKLEEYVEEISVKAPNRFQAELSDAKEMTDIERNAKEKAVKDAKLFSDTYFTTFVEQVKQNLKTQLETFGTQFDNIIKGILK